MELPLFDASFVQGSGCAGLGAVLRNGAGEVVCAGVMKHRYVLDALTAEVRAIFFSLQMAINQGILSCIVSSDSIMAVKLLTSLEPYGKEAT